VTPQFVAPVKAVITSISKRKIFAPAGRVNICTAVGDAKIVAVAAVYD
jgi:hypothetical protein